MKTQMPAELRFKGKNPLMLQWLVVFWCLCCRLSWDSGQSYVFLMCCSPHWTTGSLCFHQNLNDAVWVKRGKISSAFHKAHTFWQNVFHVLTFLRKIRRSRLRLGLSGAWDQMRSGDADPLGPKTFSSSKHPVSISYMEDREGRWGLKLLSGLTLVM